MASELSMVILREATKKDAHRNYKGLSWYEVLTWPREQWVDLSEDASAGSGNERGSSYVWDEDTLKPRGTRML